LADQRLADLVVGAALFDEFIDFRAQFVGFRRVVGEQIFAPAAGRDEHGEELLFPRVTVGRIGAESERQSEYGATAHNDTS
jgi:hypothetical protein